MSLTMDPNPPVQAQTILPPPHTCALERLDEQTHDSLVEALVYATPYKDPFDQAAAVAEYLWERNIVFAHSGRLINHMIAAAALLLFVGLILGTALHGIIDGVPYLDPILDLMH